MGLLSRLYGNLFRRINRWRAWYRFPTPVQVLNLVALRINLRRFNLHDADTAPTEPSLPGPGIDPKETRTIAGSYNDLGAPAMGQSGMRFARNVPLGAGYEEGDLPGGPNPRTVSRLLMTRDPFIPATTLNVLAAAWIQFQVHDWFAHGKNDGSVLHEIPIEPDDNWPGGELKIPRTRPDPTRGPADAGRPVTFQCMTSHWWDSSQVYGAGADRMAALREGTGGRLKLTEDGLLPRGEGGVDQTGVNDNWWIGLTAMHTLFAREHNAICDRLARAYPHLGDDRLYRLGRLINGALIAKIHTVEWTPALLNTPALRFGMRANWWGLLGRDFKKRYGRIGSGEILSGIIGSATDHHTAPYAMTEEFATVYRMHNLIPDDYAFFDLRDGAALETADLKGVAGARARAVTDRIGLDNVLYSLGIAHPGALTLRNFPRGLQTLTNETTGRVIDLAAVDILRDRERGLPRYNAMRRLLDMPPLTRVSELSDDPEIQDRLKRLYGDDPDRIDLQVGLFGEAPPPGFAFSDTAFRIFILMASRRIKSDRFLTADYRPEIYTQVGLDWIEETTMSDVILRHAPALAGSIADRENAFAPWTKTG